MDEAVALGWGRAAETARALRRNLNGSSGSWTSWHAAIVPSPGMQATDRSSLATDADIPNSSQTATRTATPTRAAIVLDGAWRLSYGRGPGPDHPEGLKACAWPTIPATVPGTVESALVDAGIEPDPRVGDAAWGFQRYELHDWWYVREFTAEACPDQTSELVFDGMDCLATVWLNGVHLGDSANALIAHRFAAGCALRDGSNRLVVRIRSAIAWARSRPVAPGCFAGTLGWDGLRLRKPPHQFGWDIAPRLACGGLWRGVRLERLPRHRVAAVRWTTVAIDADRRSASLIVEWELDLDLYVGSEAAIPSGSLEVEIELMRAGRAVLSRRVPVLGHHGRLKTELEDIDAWWPRAWGEPALHRATLRLVDGARVLDESAETIGLRTVRLVRTDAVGADGKGLFHLEVNGRRLWAKGTNWVFLDALHHRDASHRDRCLDMVLELGCDMVRMWGGNVYEDDAFFERCDREGLLVWQDFAFACAIYPQDDEFARQVEIEAEAVITRLRNHACLALWCGGNETDEAHLWEGYGRDPSRDRITRDVLARAVAALDPCRPYVPSSPEITAAALTGAQPVDRHLWGPRDDFLSAYYRSSTAPFVSEIGYHGCPEEASLREMLGPGVEPWPVAGNRAWLPLAVRCGPRHQDNDARIELMRSQARLLTGEDPACLRDFIDASQMVQAEALKSFVLQARARKGASSGLLWWNLRDGWPIVSDAIVDYFFRRKLAYDVLARAQAGVLAIATERDGWGHRVAVVNDLLVDVRGVVDVVGHRTGPLLSRSFVAPANGIADAGTLPAADAIDCWRVRWTSTSGTVSQTHLLVGPRPYPLETLRAWYAWLGYALPPHAMA